MADGMDEIAVFQLGPGKVFVEGDYIGDSKRCIVTKQEWPDIIVDDSLDADEIG